jgi:hypothetical protein
MARRPQVGRARSSSAAARSPAATLFIPASRMAKLIAAAHAGCFFMALAATLAAAGHPPAKIHTRAKVHFGPVPGGFAISRIELATEGSVPGIDPGDNAATEATSSVLSKRLRSEVGRIFSKNCFSTSASEMFCCFAMLATKLPGTFRRRRAARTEFTVTPVGHGFREAARDGHLGGLGHAVGNHLRWNMLAKFAGNENDATPVFLQHSRQIFSCETDTT